MSRERRGLFAAVWLGGLVFLSSLTLADPDLFGHTLYGLRAETLGVLTERTDPYSYTVPGAAWVNHEWLFERLLACAWRTGGNAGLVAFRNVWLIALFAMLWRVLAPSAEVSLPAGWLLVVFTTECLSNYTIFVRPQLATYCGTVATLLVLRRQWERISGGLWLLPLVLMVWTNLHGGFLAGMGLVLLFASAAVLRGISKPDRRREAILWFGMACATGLSTFMNPYGGELHRMLWDHLVTPQAVLEWQSVWSATPSPLYPAPFVLAGAVLCLSRRWAWIDLVIVLIVGWQAASHIRHIALFALTIAVLLPGAVSDVLERLFPQLFAAWSRPEKRGLRWTAACLILAFLGMLHLRAGRDMWRDGIRPWHVAVETQSGVPGMPVNVVCRMKEWGAKGRLITDYGWAQFALWHLWPHVKVTFDGRYRTVYPAAVEQAFLELQRSQPDSRATLLERDPPDFVVAPVGGGLERAFVGREGWQELYRDDQAVLFTPRQQRLSATTEWSKKRVPSATRWVVFPGCLQESREFSP